MGAMGLRDGCPADRGCNVKGRVPSTPWMQRQGTDDGLHAGEGAGEGSQAARPSQSSARAYVTQPTQDVVRVVMHALCIEERNDGRQKAR